MSDNGIGYTSLAGMGSAEDTWDGNYNLDQDPNAGFVITSFEEGTLGKENTRCFKVGLECIHGVNKGRKLMKPYFITDKAIKRTRHFLNVISAFEPWTGPPSENPENLNHQKQVGKKFSATVVMRKGKGGENPITGQKIEAEMRSDLQEERPFRE